MMSVVVLIRKKFNAKALNIELSNTLLSVLNIQV